MNESYKKLKIPSEIQIISSLLNWSEVLCWAFWRAAKPTKGPGFPVVALMVFSGNSRVETALKTFLIFKKSRKKI